MAVTFLTNEDKTELEQQLTEQAETLAEKVSFTEQTLTEEQKTQARKNVGAVTEIDLFAEGTMTENDPGVETGLGRVTTDSQEIGSTLVMDASITWYRYFIIKVRPGQRYQISLRAGNLADTHSFVFFTDDNMIVLDKDVAGTGAEVVYKEYPVTIPDGCTRLIFQSSSAKNLSENSFNKIEKLSTVATPELVDDKLLEHLGAYHPDAGAVPDYLQENIDHVATGLSGQNGNVLNIAFLADLHYIAYSSDTTAYDAIYGRCVKGIEEISKKQNIDFTVLGGDYLWNSATSTTAARANYAYAQLQKCFYPLKDKLFAVKGNHDDNSLVFTGTTLNSEENVIGDHVRYSYLGQQYTQDVVTKYGNAEKSYGYVDFKRQKVRCIFLNTVDIPYIYDNGVLRYTGQGTSAFSNDQLNFVADALMFDDTDWAVMFFSHHPLAQFATIDSGYMAGYGITPFWGVVNAFINKTTYDFTGTVLEENISVSVDYTSNQSNEVIACICGHKHRDVQGFVNGVLNICIAAAGLGQTAYDSTGTQITYTYETATETAFDVFSIDRSTKTIKAVRFGAGQDRTISYVESE